LSLLAGLKGKGIQDRLLHPYDALWDARLGISTFGFIPAVGDSNDAAWQGHYQPTPYRDIFAVLRHAGIGPGDVYVDLGCGLGRTVFAAHWLGAKRAVGVEIDHQLAAQCERSAASHRHARAGDPARAVKFVCTPAQTYLHRDTTVVFLFHPFGAGTLKEVVDALDAELTRRPRSLKVIYFNPVYDHVFEQSRHFKRCEHWPAERRMLTASGDYAVTFWATRGWPR
jgi:SAM-dependent methyltransferase